MHVNVTLLVEVGIDAQLLGTGPNDGHGCLDRLLHHITQRTGVSELALARHVGGLDGEQIAPHFGPRQTTHLTHLVLVGGLAVIEALHPEELLEVLLIDLNMLDALVQQNALDRFATDLGDFALQTPHPGFTGVVTDHPDQRRILDGDLGGFQAVALDLLGNQMLLGNVELLIFGVTGEADHFHPVQQRTRDVHGVGGGHEHHVRQVIIHFQIVIVEAVVLFGIQHFQQGGCGIAAHVRAHLVDFVEQEQRVLHADFRHLLDELAGHGTDIGTAVTADLRFVTHPTEGHPHIFAAGRLGDGLAQRGLAHTGRANQTEDGALELVHPRLHRQIFEDAILDLLKAIVIGIQHLLRLAQVFLDLGARLPRHLYHPVHIAANHGSLGRHGRHHLQLGKLGLGLFTGIFRHAGLFNLAIEGFKLIRAIFQLTQLFLDGLHLLVEVILALALLHLLLDASTDALLDLQQVNFRLHHRHQEFDALGNRDDLQHLLLVFQLERHVSGHGIGQTRSIVDRRNRGEHLGRDLLVELDVTFKLADGGANQNFLILVVNGLGGDVLGLADKEILVVDHPLQASTLPTLYQHLDGAIRQFEHLQNIGHCPDGEDLLHGRLIG